MEWLLLLLLIPLWYWFAWYWIRWLSRVDSIFADREYAAVHWLLSILPPVAIFLLFISVAQGNWLAKLGTAIQGKK